VLQSDQQGIGKSTFWKILGGPWFSDSLGDLRDVREDRLQLHSAWIHEWGEIDNVMGKRESETLKRFISSSRDDVRRPYGRGTEQLLRSCGLVGTTNRRDFIKDPTGNRRFPIIQIRKVQLDWVKANRERMWGSAVAAYRAGQQWHYDTTENASISKAAQDYAAEDPLRDQIETWIDDHPDITAIAMPVIVFHLNRERQRDQEFARQVALRLTALGWRKSQQRERGYLPNGDRHDKATIWVAPAPTSGPPS
jgi:predicted P-loop ATPase